MAQAYWPKKSTKIIVLVAEHRPQQTSPINHVRTTSATDAADDAPAADADATAAAADAADDRLVTGVIFFHC